MKKVLSLLITFAMLLSVFSVAMADGEDPTPEIEKPVLIDVEDRNGAPVTGVKLQLTDAEDNVLDVWDSDGTERTFFLKEGEYSLESITVPSGYVLEAETAISVVPTAEEQATDYVGTVTYDHDHPEICSKASHIGLELYTVGHDESDQVVAYCFNHGLKNPTPDSRYKMLVANQNVLFEYARNKSDDITKEELYDHVLSIIYHSADAQALYGLDDVVTRYLTYMALKNFTDPKSFPQTVLGAMINHAHGEKHEFPQEYIDAYNYLISVTDHPDNYFLYIYYPDNYNSDNAFQCLLTAKQAEPQHVALRLAPATQFGITLEWNDQNNEQNTRPLPSALVSKLTLLADGKNVTAQYRDKIVIVDNEDNTYSVTADGLPLLNDNNQVIKYKMKIAKPAGYFSNKSTAQNGDTIVLTYRSLLVINPIKPGKPIKPIEPIPVNPINPLPIDPDNPPLVKNP